MLDILNTWRLTFRNTACTMIFWKWQLFWTSKAYKGKVSTLSGENQHLALIMTKTVKIMAICCLCHAQGSTNCFPINAFSCVIMPVLAFRANLLLVLDLVWRMVTSKSWPCIQLVTSKGLDLRLLERVLGKWLFFLNWSRGFLMFNCFAQVTIWCHFKIYFDWHLYQGNWVLSSVKLSLNRHVMCKDRKMSL